MHIMPAGSLVIKAIEIMKPVISSPAGAMQP